MSDILPRLSDNDFTERAGVNEVARVTNLAQCVWRELHLKDVGIDGHIEYFNDNHNATGRIVLLQIKSGTSYFANATSTHVPYHPKPKHSHYWEQSLLPVILVLHNPASNTTLWTDARRQLRSDNSSPILVPRQQTFDKDGVLLALQSDGPLPRSYTSPTTLVKTLIQARHSNPLFPVSFFDLFVNGLTDLGRSLYFGMDLANEIAGCRSALHGTGGISIGPQEYAFIDTYIQFIIAYDLARFDYDWCVRIKADLDMVPTCHAPLTSRGSAILQAISTLGGDHFLRERYVQMTFDMDEMTTRIKAIDQFKKSTFP